MRALLISVLLNLVLSLYSLGADLRVLTFNTWLLRAPLGIDVAKDIDKRFRFIPERVASVGADVVCLQEVWDKEMRMSLIRSFKRYGYKYAAFREVAGQHEYVKQRMGNGLLIVSKLMLDPKIVQFKFSEAPNFFESLTVKGAIKTRVRLPDMRWIDLYNTHVGAVSYDDELQDYNRHEMAVRLRQVIELADFIRVSRTSRDMILAGDFNSNYYEGLGQTLSEEYTRMTYPAPYGLDLYDAHRHVFGFTDPPAWTWDHRNGNVGNGIHGNIRNEVIDYVFASKEGEIEPTDSRIVLQENIPTTGKPVSDHYGVLATLMVRERH